MPCTALGLWTALFLGGKKKTTKKKKNKGKQRAHSASGGSWDGHVGAYANLYMM